MSKRSSTEPDAFANGLRQQHYEGLSIIGNQLALTAEGSSQWNVRWLKRGHGTNQKALQLADKLDSCRPEHRCYSGACPVCAQAAQELFVDLVCEFSRTEGRRDALTKAVAVTLVPTGLTSAPGNLGNPTMAQVRRRITDRLAKAGVQMAFCVAETTLVEHADGRYPKHWAWHVHGIALTRNRESLAEGLAKAFPRNDMVPRPRHVVTWDNGIAWLRYCHKLERFCRVGIDDAIRYDVHTHKTRTYRATTLRRLTGEERLEQLLFHDRIGLGSRIITKGAQLRSTREGCSLVKMRRPRR